MRARSSEDDRALSLSLRSNPKTAPTGVSPPRFALPRGATGGRPRTPSLSERRMSIHRIRYQVVLMASEASPSLLFSCRATVSLTDTYDVVYVQKGTKAIAYLLINQIVMSHILRKNGRPPKVRVSSRPVHPSFLFTSPSSFPA